MEVQSESACGNVSLQLSKSEPTLVLCRHFSKSLQCAPSVQYCLYLKQVAYNMKKKALK